MEGYQQESGRGREREKVQRISSINGRQKIGQGKVKNSIETGDAKKLICMTHGQELKAGNAGGRGCAGQKGIKGGEMGQL